jgi:O-antigen ligase
MPVSRDAFSAAAIVKLLNPRTVLLGLVPIAILVASPQRFALSLGIAAIYMAVALWWARPARADRVTLIYICVVAAFIVLSLLRANLIDSLNADQRAYAGSKALYFVAVVLPLCAGVAVLVKDLDAVRPIALVQLAIGVGVAVLAIIYRSGTVLGAERYAWEGNLIALGFLIAVQLSLVRNLKLVVAFAVVAVIGLMFAQARQSVVMMAAGLVGSAAYWGAAVDMRDGRRLRAAISDPRVVLPIGVLIAFGATVYLTFAVFGPLTRDTTGAVENPCHCLSYRVVEVFQDPGGRSVLVKSALQVFAAHPVIGAGLGSFAGVVKGYQYPHSIALEVAAELGLVGFAVIYLPLLVGALRLVRQGIAAQSETVAMLLVLALGYFVIANLSGDLPSARGFWIFAVLVVKFAWSTARERFDGPSPIS